MFIVRYDGEGQQKLNTHTDYSHISFNILLNDDFVGGGTRFYNRLHLDIDSNGNNNSRRRTYYDANPQPGHVLINNAMVSHEGLATMEGT